jgi:hypothetical protein
VTAPVGVRRLCGPKVVEVASLIVRSTDLVALDPASSIVTALIASLCLGVATPLLCAGPRAAPLIR